MRTTPLVALALSALLALAGCSDDDAKPASSPTAGASSASSGSASSGSASSDRSSADDGTSAAAPADGPLMAQDVSSLHAPAGWKTRDNGMPWSRNASNPKGAGNQNVLFMETPWPGLADPLDEMATRAIDKDYFGKAKRLPDTTLDGEPAYHLQSKDGRGPVDEIGTLAREKWIQIVIYTQGMTPAQRRETVDSIVASFTWTD